jgi:hypothetical protein
MLRRFSIMLAVLCFTAASASDKDFWVTKPYQQWSAEETAKMLKESPWAITTTLSAAVNPSTQIGSPTGPAITRDYESNGQVDPSVTYNVRLCSARPLREAIVRSSELGAHYDSMTSAQKLSFDAQANKFLAVSFDDRVAVCVNVKSNVDNYQSQMRAYWCAQTAPKLFATVFLDAGKERIALQKYACKDDNFQFTFPRPKDKITADMPLGIEFVHPRVDQIGEQKLLLNFKPKKMVVNGEPVF